jgi:serine protease AprX
MGGRTAIVAAAAVVLVGLVPVAARAVDDGASPRPASVAAPGLADALAAVPPGGTLLAAVQGTDVAAVTDAVASAGLTIRAEWPEVDAVIVDGSPAAVADLLDDARVTYVEPDRLIEPLLDTSGIATRAEDARAASTGLLRADGLPYDGSGVSIAVLDTGIDGTHPMFTEDGVTKVARNLRQVCAVDFCDSYVAAADTDVMAAGGHGTHVAGIAAGYERTTGDGRVVRGAAPGATLVGLSHGAALGMLNATAGLRWVLTHHEDPCGDGSCPPIRVVNNSWGSPPGPHDPDSVESKVVNQLVADGVSVVFAASNDGGDGSANRVSPQAQNPTPGVLSVANYHDDNTGNRNGGLDSTSSRAEKGQVATYPDISAVGSEILSSCRPHLPICYAHASLGDPNREYYQLGGTSMAAPYIAGVAALLYEADPSLSPADVEDIIEDTAHKFGDPNSYEPDVHNVGATTSFDKGHGLVDVTAALAATLGRPDPGTAECLPAPGTGFTDPAADDTRFGVEVGVSELHTDALDIRHASWTWSDSDDELVVVLGVGDLADVPPSGSAGELFYAFFTVDGARWFADAEDNRALGVTGSLSHDDGTVRTSFAAIEVAFDREADTVTLHVPQSVSAGGFDFSLDDGDVISGFTIESRRTAGALAPVADVAAGGCPITVSRP